MELDGAVPLTVVSEEPGTASTGGPRTSFHLAKDLAAVSPWQKVLYDRSTVEAALKELVAAAERKDGQIQATSGMEADDRDFAYDALQEDAYEVLSTIAHLIKTPGFTGENEVRVVATLVWGQEHIHYRAGRNGITGYVILGGGT